VIKEVIKLLAFPEESGSDDIAIEDLLTTRQRRQSQATSVLTESQMGGEVTEQDKEQPGTGLLTPETSTQDQRDGRDDALSTESEQEQRALDEQLAQEQQYNVEQGSQDLSATQIEGYIPDRYENNAPRRRNLDLSTKNVIEGPRRTRRNADLQAPERWHSHAVSYGGSVNEYLRAFLTALKAELTTKIHRSQVPRAPRSYQELESHLFGEQFRQAAQKEYREIWSKGCFAKTTHTAETADAEVLPLMWVFTYKFDEDGYLY
jgi:hypothetical protein